MGTIKGALAQLGKHWQVSAMASVMAVSAALIYVIYLGGVTPRSSSFEIPWPILLGAFAAGEVLVIHLQWRREAHSISASEVAFVLALLFASPGTLLATQVVATLFVLAVIDKQQPEKLVFNVTLSLLCATAGTATFHAVAPAGAHIGPMVWLAALVAVFVVDLIGAIAVTAVIYVYERILDRTELVGAIGMGFLIAATTTLYTLLGAMALQHDMWAGALFTLLSLALMAGFRQYSSVLQAHSNLELLWGFSLDVGEASGRGILAKAIADQVRKAVRAEIVLVHLFNRGAAKKVVAISADPDVPPKAEIADLPSALQEELATGNSLLIRRQTKDPDEVAFLRTRELRDAILAPIKVESETVGFILVADKPGDIATFDADDVRLVETLAYHAALSVDRGHLVENLQEEAARNEHLARHDALTGLLNRSYFTEKLEASLRTGPESLAVLLIDLDHFKEINDTLGHHTGDQVLQEVGARVRTCFRGDASVARLGGDEFAIAIADLTSEATRGLAQRVLAAMSAPVEISGIAVDVGCSLGIAHYPSHGPDAATLLQHADVALYQAKESRGAFAIYDPARDESSTQRLALVADLRRAIDAGEVKAVYQPKIRLSDGKLVGAEALARWDHHEHGRVSPDEFIALAEHTGLIEPLTTSMLHQALSDCASWRTHNPELTVAVNLSPRSLLDTSLPELVGQAIADAGLPTSALRLEITEGAIMADPQRAGSIIRRLASMGISMSIDDFGTGYSSFAYLRDLPVDELKIDRSFVMRMSEDDRDRLIVKAVLDLATSLSLTPVAEGVEDHLTQTMLASMGCTLGQGYHFAAPMSAEEFNRWIEASWPSASGNVVPLTR